MFRDGRHAVVTARRRQAAALQGAFGTTIFMAAKNLGSSRFQVAKGKEHMANAEPLDFAVCYLLFEIALGQGDEMKGIIGE